MKNPLILLLFIMLSSVLNASEPLDVGASAPQLVVVNHRSEKIALVDLYAKGPVLIYFYPKADTPGCTKQACNLKENFSSVREAGITVLGVSYDKIQAQAAFSEKYQLPFDLIAGGEDDHALAKAFGVGGMMGGIFKPYKRQSFLIVGGKVVWRDLSAKPASQSQDVLDALKQVAKKTD